MSSETAWGLSVVVVYAAILVWQARHAQAEQQDPEARRRERAREQAERAAQRRFW